MALRTGNKPRKTRLGAAAVRKHKAKLPRIAAMALLLLTCLLHLKAAFLAQLAINSGAGTEYFRSELSDPNSLARLARKEHLVDVNLPGAADLYQKALTHFVLHIPSWLGLVEVYNDMGHQEKARAALHFVQNFAATDEQAAWSRAMLAHDLDELEIMTDNLRLLAAGFPGKRRQVFALAEQHWPEADALLDRFDPVLHPDILEYFIVMRDPAKAATAWARVEGAGVADRKIVLRYVNFLLERENVREAGQIWRKYYGLGDSLLFNRELREPFLGSGFGWRISRAEGVSWRQAAGGQGLEIRFAGSANPLFRLSQLVPLAPGRYLFSATMSSQDLTTDQRPRWLLTGYKCEGLRVTGDMVPPSGPAALVSLTFAVPEACRAVQITLQRSESHYFDNKIAGSVTVTGPDLVQIGPAEPEATAPGEAVKGNKRIDINTMRFVR